MRGYYTIGRTGSQKYLRGGKYVDIYKTHETLRCAIPQLIGLPIQINHGKQVKVGHINDAFLANNGLIKASLVVNDSISLNDTGFSLSYKAYEDIKNGRWEHTELEYDHLALVDKPRCGAVCTIKKQK